MSKATFLPVNSDDPKGRLHGYRYPIFYTELGRAFARLDPMQGRGVRSLVVVHVETIDWQSHPLFKRMSRVYTVTILMADSTSDFALMADDRITLRDVTWTEVLAEVRKFFVRGYHYSWGETTPFLSILDGGYSDRICREILAVCPHPDLQGRGDGK